jgi:cyclin-dependent kinase 7
VYITKDVLHLVLEYCPHDLEKVIRDKTIFLKTQHIKTYLFMLLNGISHCHKNFILHRGFFLLFILFYFIFI